MNFRSSKVNLIDFLNSTVWQDLKELLEYHISSVRDLMEVTESTDELFRCQGRVEALRRIISVIETLPDQRIIEED